jgi:membrane dipeptidase
MKGDFHAHRLSNRPIHRRTFAFALVAAAAILAPAQAGLRSSLDTDDDVSARRVHKATLVLDAHADLPAPYDWGSGRTPTGGEDQISPARLREGGVDAQVIAVFVPQGEQTPEAIAAALEEAERKARAIKLRAEADPREFVLATSTAAIRQAAQDNKTAIILSLLNAYPLQGNISSLEAFQQLGVRIIGLTHAGNNGFADSSRPQPRDVAGQNNGLSQAGLALIARANALGITVDVSQMSETATLQAIAASTTPVLASHSGVKGLVDHARNLSDKELDAIKAKGGVVAINAFPTYLKAVPPENLVQIAAARARYGAVNGYEGLSPAQRTALGAEVQALTPRAGVADLVNLIDYAVARIGIDHVAVSSDFNHGGGSQAGQMQALHPMSQPNFCDVAIRRLTSASCGVATSCACWRPPKRYPSRTNLPFAIGAFHHEHHEPRAVHYFSQSRKGVKLARYHKVSAQPRFQGKRNAHSTVALNPVRCLSSPLALCLVLKSSALTCANLCPKPI